jgi:hypothetical protein
MVKIDTVIAVFSDHAAADAAVKRLAEADFAVRQLSIVGKGYHTEEKVTGFYNAGDRIRFWGSRGVVWGGLWGLFLGGMFVTIPAVGGIVVLGYIAAAALLAIENAIVVGGLSAIGAALFSIGIPRNSVLRYEAAVKADEFLVMAHGSAVEAQRAQTVLALLKPASLNLYDSHRVLTPEVIAIGAG